MFLSQLVLNLNNRTVRHDLRDPYEMHRTFWRCYPQLRRDIDGACLDRIMFRLDIGDRDGTITVIVQADIEAHWEKLPEGYLRAPAPQKEFTPQFSQGQRLRFRLRANPTRRVREASVGPDGQTPVNRNMIGKRVGLYREEEQIRWLLRKGETGGFTIPGSWVKASDPEINKPIELPNFRVDAIPEARTKWGFQKDRQAIPGTCHAVRFEGVLVVTDPILFAKTLAAGLGSAKSFGFGLLSIAPG